MCLTQIVQYPFQCYIREQPSWNPSLRYIIPFSVAKPVCLYVFGLEFDGESGLAESMKN